jgi:glucokinase
VTPSVIGVDLGGTKVATARLQDGALSEPVIEPTQLASTESLIDQVASLVERVRDGNLDAVGVGVPSVVEFSTGRVVSSVNIPLADVPLRRVLGDRVGVPVYVDNDATVAALAEAHDERLRPVARNLVMLTVGTGIGGGIVLEGRIYRGSTGGAGELGQTIIGLDLTESVPGPTRFPQPGSLEKLAAGHALDELGTAMAGEHPESGLAGRAHPDGRVLGPDVVAAAREGDHVAAAAVELWARRLGIGVANAINTFDPDEVVIGGGGVLAGELLLEPATEVARGYVNPGLGANTAIRLARHGVRAGVLGAALLAAHELEDAEHAPAGAGAPARAAAPARDRG